VPADPISSIDWDKIWEDQMEITSFKGDGVDHWNKVASRMQNFHSPEDGYTRELLQRVKLSPDLTVLDVGCGTGAITVPLAERTRSVTALDLSPMMLQYLESNLKARGLTNVQIINTDFLTIDKAKLGFFDIVLASRSLPMGNLRQALVKMNHVARHRCYLTWIACRRATDVKLCEVIGVDYHPYPDYLIIANMLKTMGIQANVEIFTVANEQRYASLDEAVNNSLRGQQVDTQARDRFKAFFAEHCLPETDGWRYPFNEEWALIWWEKKDTSE
jgi:ubiquinone/menaquinone biosynthesis C-methylase UbiE